MLYVHNSDGIRFYYELASTSAMLCIFTHAE